MLADVSVSLCLTVRAKKEKNVMLQSLSHANRILVLGITAGFRALLADI